MTVRTFASDGPDGFSDADEVDLMVRKTPLISSRSLHIED